MIDYSTVKFAYTSGNEFTLTGSDYSGYFNIQSGDAFTGRYYSLTSLPLVSKPKFKSDLFTSDLFQDRLIQDTLSLPYPFDSIEIPPNETLSMNVFNDRLQKLYYNSLFLYSKIFLASSDIPIGYNAVAGLSSGDSRIRWFPQTSSSSITLTTFQAINNEDLDNISNFIVREYDDKSGYAIFGITPSSFVALSSNDTKTEINILQQTAFVNDSNILTYGALSGLTLSDKYLFISDTERNLIYKYNVEGFFNNDRVINNRRIFVESLGGYGNALKATKFNAPGKIFANQENDRLYVWDTANRCTKIYDLNFVHIKTISLGTKRLQRIVCFGYYKPQNFIYVVMYDGVNDSYSIRVCDADLTVIEEYVLEDEMRESSHEFYDFDLEEFYTRDYKEEFIDIQFSQQDSNIFYLVSTNYVYKKFISRPEKTIGKWLFYRSGASTIHIWNYEFTNWDEAEFLWNDPGSDTYDDVIINKMQIIPKDTNIDDIFLFMGNLTAPFNRIAHYDEFTIFDSVLTQTNLEIYSKDEIGVDRDDLLQGFVFNKELYKLLFNLFTIKNLIRGRFKANYDYQNNLVYDRFAYFDDSELLKIMVNNLEDIYVHENEIMTNPSVLNRIFKNIYYIQQNIVDVVGTKITNIKSALSGGQTVLLQ